MTIFQGDPCGHNKTNMFTVTATCAYTRVFLFTYLDLQHLYFFLCLELANAYGERVAVLSLCACTTGYLIA